MAGDTDQLEQLVVKMATTPAHHLALADYYRANADTARAEAHRHRSMAITYRSGKIRNRQLMGTHCDRIVSAQEALAKEYEELAALHEQEAKGEQ